MKKTESSRWLILCLAAMLLSGCAMVDKAPQTSALRVRGLFDGADAVHVRGDTLWIQHYAYQLPGKWHGLDEPTYVNGEKWFPEWNANRSDVLRGFSTNGLPSEPVHVEMSVTGPMMGKVNIFQQPAEENDYTLIISVDDRAPEGAHWYTLDLDW